MRAASKRPPGFTLIELLLAVVVLALLMMILSNGISLVTHHLNRNGDQLDRAQLTALVQNYLRNALSQAIPVPAAGADTGALDFDGTPGSITFVTRAPISSLAGGFVKIDLRAQGNRLTGTAALVAGWRPYPPAGRGEPDAGSSRELLSGVRQVEFAYFDPGGPDQPAVWRPAWHDMPSLPALVRLAVTFADGTAMPDLIVAPRLANPPPPLTNAAARP